MSDITLNIKHLLEADQSSNDIAFINKMYCIQSILKTNICIIKMLSSDISNEDKNHVRLKCIPEDQKRRRGRPRKDQH